MRKMGTAYVQEEGLNWRALGRGREREKSLVRGKREAFRKRKKAKIGWFGELGKTRPCFTTYVSQSRR